jgi:hypothetical protein
MISYETENILVQFRGDLPRLSLTGLLSSQATFSVTLSPGFNGQLFLVKHTDYFIELMVADGKVTFRRNGYLSEKSIDIANWRRFCVADVGVTGGAMFA